MKNFLLLLFTAVLMTSCSSYLHYEDFYHYSPSLYYDYRPIRLTPPPPPPPTIRKVYVPQHKPTIHHHKPNRPGRGRRK